MTILQVFKHDLNAVSVWLQIYWQCPNTVHFYSCYAQTFLLRWYKTQPGNFTFVVWWCFAFDVIIKSFNIYFPVFIIHNRIVLMDDAIDCLMSFSDFIYSFQIQFYYEGNFQKCIRQNSNVLKINLDQGTYFTTKFFFHFLLTLIFFSSPF